MALTVGRLTAEHLVDPRGLDTARPRLSWVVTDDRVQSADCTDVRYVF